MEAAQSIFTRITSPDHLFSSWDQFRHGKQHRKDVQQFESALEQHIFHLASDLANGTYRHGPYVAFTISDPKQRRIHKATVRDRIVHHAVATAITPLFEPTFIAHSYSCRIGKGTHRAVTALEAMLRKVSRNATRPCFALKCDIHQFFASLDHTVLLDILRHRLSDARTLTLLEHIVESFPRASPAARHRTGVPIGNLTSQLFANVYLNELDQFIKHDLRVRHYVRYTDDFVIVAEDIASLQRSLPPIATFLRDRLRLALHPRKVSIRKYRQGIDFLGIVLLPHHRGLRAKTRHRMVRTLRDRASECSRDPQNTAPLQHSLQSYLGMLSHVDAYRLSQDTQNLCWYWLTN